MSAMELFRARVAESAKAAAGAARQLSSLDEMAQNDDYVQSEGLRVSDKKDRTSSASSFTDNSEIPSVVEDLSDKFVDAFSTVARQHNRPRPVSKSHHSSGQSTPLESGSDRKVIPREQKQSQKPKPSSSKPKLVSSVAAFYDQNDKIRNASAEKRGSKTSALKTDQSLKSLATIPSSPEKKANVLLVNGHHAHILHELDYDSETDSSDDENSRELGNNKSDADLELGRLASAAELEQELEESISRQNSLNSPTGGTHQKDVNRFMKMTADLEIEREALLKPLETVPESAPTNSYRTDGANGLWTYDTRGGSAGEETTKALRAGMSWVRNVASPQLEAFSKQIITKVSDSDLGKKAKSERPQRGPMIGPRHNGNTKNDVHEEKITMTTSASFLADDDMAELERIRMRNSPSKVMVLVQTCLGNPRLAFIAVTMVLALFAYFYSRHRSVDDVL